MTDKLPPNLLALFAPRPPLRFLPPSDHPSGERKTREISGIAQFLPALKEYIETDDHKPTESWLQRHDRKKLEKKERQEKLLKDGPTSCEGYPLCPEYLYLPCPTSGHACLVNFTHMLTISFSCRQATRGSQYSW